MSRPEPHLYDVNATSDDYAATAAATAHVLEQGSTRYTPVESPPLWLTFLEARAAAEYATWSLARPLLERIEPGDGHPVLVMPGFMTSDRSTVRLRALLRQLGYRTYGWGLGANLGPTPKIVDGIRARIEAITEARDQPISLVGWSLGGVFARVISREAPDVVRQVVTLGSPFRMTASDPSAASQVWDALSPLHDQTIVARLDVVDRPALPVPATSIYTRTDGIVQWRTCLESKGPQSENIEVYGSHCGLGFNPAAAYALADRLAQPAGVWTRFRAPLWARAAYPRPANYKPRGA